MPKGKVFLGADHAGFALKSQLLQELPKTFPEMDFKDLGCPSEESVDYPKYAGDVARKVAEGEGRGILICGSGIGMSIAANKVDGVRAAVCWDTNSAVLSREHNDSNVLCLGSRLIPSEAALEICRAWLATHFLAGRHQRRIDLIQAMEKGDA